MNLKAINHGWNCNYRILEDVFEALVAAISLDKGLDLAQKFVLNCIIKYVPMDSIETEDNFKDISMRYTQAEGVDLPQESLPYQQNHQMLLNPAVGVPSALMYLQSVMPTRFKKIMWCHRASSRALI